MRKLVIDNGVVVNVIEADDTFVLEGFTLIANDEAGPGWTHNADGSFTAPPVPDPVVPTNITPLQARRHLRALGIKAQADAYLATLSDEAQEEWEYCITVERDNQFLKDAAIAMVGEEDADPWLDAFFIAANKIKA